MIKKMWDGEIEWLYIYFILWKLVLMQWKMWKRNARENDVSSTWLKPCSIENCSSLVDMEQYFG